MKCALCGNEADLMQSHIIPKLVYKRIRSKKNSRFRALNEITRVLQDGEKRPMLCHDCEEMFSSYEVKFVSDFLDDYLESNELKKISSGVVKNYILTVAWRILWDDLYRMNSHVDHFARYIFEEFCDDLGQYLLSIGKGNGTQPPERFKTEIYQLSKLIKEKAVNDFATGCLFGYSVYSININSAYIIVYYAGLVFVTEYKFDKKKYLVIGAKPILFKKIVLRKEVKNELRLQFSEMAKQYKNAMTPELQSKIQKYYESH